MIDGLIREIPTQLHEITWAKSSKIAEIPTLIKDNLLSQKTFIPETCRSLKNRHIEIIHYKCLTLQSYIQTHKKSFCRKIIEFFNGTFFLHWRIQRTLNQILDVTDKLVKKIDKERFKPLTPPPPYTNPDTVRSDRTTRSIDGFLCPPFLIPTPAALEMPSSSCHTPIPVVEAEPIESEPVTMIHKSGVTVHIQHEQIQQQQQKFISAKSILRSPIMDPHQG